MRLKDLPKTSKTLNSFRVFILLRSRALISRSTKYNRLQTDAPIYVYAWIWTPHCHVTTNLRPVTRQTGSINDVPYLKKASSTLLIILIITCICRSQWPRGLRRRSAAARLLRLWVRILPGTWKFVCCECCVLSGRGLCDGLITRPEESYRLWCVVVCYLEISLRMRRPWPAVGCSAIGGKNPPVYLQLFIRKYSSAYEPVGLYFRRH